MLLFEHLGRKKCVQIKTKMNIEKFEKMYYNIAENGGIIVNKEIIKEQLEYIEKIRSLNEGKELYYNILTMGCQLNENDSEKISGMATKMGYVYTDNLERVNLYIINTCCVRENAEEKLFGKLGELKKLREKNNAIIALCGCMMQEKHIQEKLKQSYPYVDIIFGTHTLHKFPEDLYKVIEEKKKLEDILDIDGKVYEGLPIKRDSSIKASVTIMSAKASKDDGHIEGKIYNNTEENITDKYMKVELFSDNSVSLGKEYVKIDELNPKDIKDFKINFTCDNVKSFKITLITPEEKAKEDEEKNKPLIQLNQNKEVEEITNQLKPEFNN